MQLLKWVYYRLKNGFRCCGYGKFGSYSYMARPLKVVGKKNIFIGDNCSIYKNARLEAITKWKGQPVEGELHFGNGVSLEQGCHIIAASKLVIEEGCTLSANVYISDCGHSFQIPDLDVIQQELEIKPVHIGRNSFLGFGVCVLPGVTVGKGCIIGANAVVTKDIPDYCVAAGAPARIIKKYNFDTKHWENV